MRLERDLIRIQLILIYLELSYLIIKNKEKR